MCARLLEPFGRLLTSFVTGVKPKDEYFQSDASARRRYNFGRREYSSDDNLDMEWNSDLDTYTLGGL